MYIPFLGDSIAGFSSEALQAHVAIKKGINSINIASAAPAFIAAGKHFKTLGWDDITGTILTKVKTKFGTKVLPDCCLPYSMLIWFTKEVSFSLPLVTSLFVQ